MVKAEKKPATNRRSAKPPAMATGLLLDDREFVRTMQRTAKLLKRTEEQRQRKERIPKHGHGGGKSRRMRALLKRPRLGSLKQRHQLLAAKVRAAGAKSPMHLSLLRCSTA